MWRVGIGSKELNKYVSVLHRDNVRLVSAPNGRASDAPADAGAISFLSAPGYGAR